MERSGIPVPVDTQEPIMVRFRRNYVPGGTYFFTVTLCERRSRALTDHIGLLREAFWDVRKAHPFR